MAVTFNIHEAKSQLSKLIARAEAGEEVIIARGGTPVVVLQPLRPKPREFGYLRDEIEIGEDFDDPLDDELLALFHGDGE